MNKGLTVGGIAGIVVGLLIQSTGTLTGMAVKSINPASVIAGSLAITVFIAALCGIIGAFLGALMQDVMEN